MALTFAREALFPDLFGEMQALTVRHWEEVALREVSGALDINEEAYRMLDSRGHLTAVTAREKGRLAGYAVYVLAPALHYRHRIIAEADVFYLAPEYRAGLAGLRLLQRAEQECIKAGAQVIQNKVKTAHDCGRLFERMGYTLAEKLYVKAVA